MRRILPRVWVAVVAVAVATLSVTAASPAGGPPRYLDQKVTITGQFSGRNLLGDLPDAPAKRQM